MRHASPVTRLFAPYAAMLLTVGMAGCSGSSPPATPPVLRPTEVVAVSPTPAPVVSPEPTPAPAVSPEPTPAPTEVPPAPRPPEFPTSVLDGTDELAMSAVATVALDIGTLGGTYQAEQGGSVLALRLRVVGGAIRAERTWREPGEAPRSRSYELRARDVDIDATSGGDAALHRTTEGVLLWERESRADGIPASYWSHYVRRVRPSR